MTTDVLHRMRDRIECMRVRPLLQSFLDGELDDAQRRRIASHLEACRRCGLAAATYESLTRRLRGLGDPVDPDAVGRLERFVGELAGEPGDDGPPEVD